MKKLRLSCARARSGVLKDALFAYRCSRYDYQPRFRAAALRKRGWKEYVRGNELLSTILRWEFTPHLCR